MTTLKQKIANRISVANKRKLMQHYLTEAMRGSEGAHVLSDFSSNQRISPWGEALVTFGAFVAFVLTAWGCWAACLALGVVK